jgi:hypothetical protein
MPRRKTLLVLTFLLSFLIIFNVSTNDELIKSVEASPTAIIVPIDYPTIQEAINKANASDTILVMPDIYHEHINITKPIKLKGENPLTTIIDGEEKNQTIINIIASNVQIEGFTIKNGSKYYGPPHYAYGIQIMNRINVTICNNILTETTLSIFLSNSNSCNIVNNKIIDNYNYGIQFSDSCFNNVVANNITSNPGGIWITSDKSKNNTLYRNNFMANTDPAPLPRGSATKWDNGAEGNYWDDYHGVDANGDGIGDEPYPEGFPPELALDKYPLMEPWSALRTHSIHLNGQSYNVTTYCNATVASFNFTKSEKQISFNVTGPSGAVSFCNVTIPKVLLNASSGNWTVFLNDENLTEFVMGENDTHTCIYFMISLSTCKVTIVGTDVIPEFPIGLLFPIFIIVTLIAIFFAKRRNRIYLDRNFQDS